MVKSVNTTDEYDIIDHDETGLAAEDLAKVRDWLQPSDYLAESGEFRRHLSSQAPGTGLWICETDEYRRWHDSPDHGSLWIKGVPGAGKSVIAASIIQHLRTTEECPVLFFFFRNIVAANFSPRALIQDWLAQLLPHSPKLQFALHSRLDTSLEETSDTDLMQLFLDGVSCVTKMYCVGDALDEMTGDNRAFLDKLNGLATHRPRSLKLLITSRPKQYLQSALRDSSIVHVSLQQRLVDADILAYLRHRVDTMSESDKTRVIPKEVINMVARRSEGLFLYAKLTMDQVEAFFSRHGHEGLHVIEESLPVGLEDTYTRLLARQREEHGISVELQILVLEAVTHASRPLRLNELANLIECICPDLKAPSGFKALIVASCGPLIEVLEDETLQVIHHSFTEFLRGDTRSTENGSGFPIFHSDTAHKRLAINCLQYLQSGSLLLEAESNSSDTTASITFEKPKHVVDIDEEYQKYTLRGVKREQDPFDYRQARLLHPFLQYAVENWAWHASHYDTEDEGLFAAVIDFLKPDDLSFRRWLVLEWGSTSKSKESTEGIPTGLHVAAFSGLSKLARVLIRGGSSVSALDAQERTPLHWAAANGHAKVVSLLLGSGAAPNPEDGSGLKPIHLAASRNRASVVKTLLLAGVEPDTIKTREDTKGRRPRGDPITKGDTPILYACKGGHLETILTIIPLATPDIVETILVECCRFNRTEAVLAVLEKSTVTGDAMYCGATALYFACAEANAQCVEALIKRGADVRKKSSWDRDRFFKTLPGDGAERAPIHRLVESWNDENDRASLEVLRLLLKGGADIEQLDGRGRTPLLIAAGSTYRQNIGVVKVPALRALLSAGANTSMTTADGDTALHTVVRNGHDLEPVRLLIEHGSDPNEKGYGGKTALQCCLLGSRPAYKLKGTESIVKYLLEHGADPSAGDNAPLYLSITACPQLFPLFLSKCNTMDMKRQCWFSLSSLYGHKIFEKHVDTLLSEGVDVDERRESDGRTLYLCCLESANNLRTLRERGAKPHVVDNGGNNALHILTKQRRCDRRQAGRLVSEGVDPLGTNKDGDTLLHLAAGQYNGDAISADYVRYLVSLGIPINAVNNKGETALHVAQQRPPTTWAAGYPDHIHFVDVISGGGDVDFEARDEEGLTALHRASLVSGLGMALMAQAGADLRSLTQDLQNVLHLVARARKANVLLQVLEDPAALDVNQKDDFGRTPVYYACAAGDAESVAFLLKHGADVHTLANDGSTPLHACAAFKTEQAIRAAQATSSTRFRGPPLDGLRPDSHRHGSRLPWYQARDGARETAKPRSYFSSIQAIVKMLVNAGVDAAAVNNKFLTALDVALVAGCAEFVQVFAADDSLFEGATRNLENNGRTAGRAQGIRLRMRVHMTLLMPRSCLETLDDNEPVREEIRGDPLRYLELLPNEDAAQLLTEEFETDPLYTSRHAPYPKLVEPHHLQIIERVPRLISWFSSYAGLEKTLDVDRRSRTLHSGETAWTPLQHACRQSASNILTLRLLVEKMNVDVNARCAFLRRVPRIDVTEIVPGQAALHCLAEADNYWQLEGMRYLLAKDADVNARDSHGETPLHVAARGMRHNVEGRGRLVEGVWRLKAVRILLDHGADPNILDNKGQSALHLASSAPEITRELLARGADVTAGAKNPLFLALLAQSVGVLEVLLDHGLSVDSTDEDRNSQDVLYLITEPVRLYALVFAALSKEVSSLAEWSAPLIRCLVDRGADLYVPLSDSRTLIHFLFEMSRYPIVDALMQVPAVSRIDFDKRDQRGRTVLMAACSWRERLPEHMGSDKEPKLRGPPVRILDHGADVTLKDDEGKTALHHMLDNPAMQEDAIIDFLNREEVASVLSQKDGRGFSPLHYALRTLRPAVCELLVAKGADILEPDPEGLTALHYIAARYLAVRWSLRGSRARNMDLADGYFDRCLALWRRFLAEGGSINAADNAGNTALHAFLASPDRDPCPTDVPPCHLEFYDALFPPDSGVDVSAVNSQGESALHAIAKRETYCPKPGHDKALFEAMMGKELDPLAEDGRGRSALDVASACGKADIVDMFGRR